MSALVESGEIIERLGDRILGRVSLDDIRPPAHRRGPALRGDEIDEDKVRLIEEAGIQKVKIRSVLTCETVRGVCAECYGRDLARGRRVNLGEAIGVIAAQSIGEPGTQLTMRTFHVGGAALAGGAKSDIEARYGGVVRYVNLHDGDPSRRRARGHEPQRRGPDLRRDRAWSRSSTRSSTARRSQVKNNEKVKPGEKIAEWEPFNMPLLSEVGGIIHYGDIIDGVTMQEELDEETGLSTQGVIESRDPDARPRISDA
jgi:DNA-directed RNA polymerase subunit beta'